MDESIRDSNHKKVQQNHAGKDMVVIRKQKKLSLLLGNIASSEMTDISKNDPYIFLQKELSLRKEKMI